MLCSRQEVGQGITNGYHSGQDDVTCLEALMHLHLVFIKLPNILFSNYSSEWLRQVVVLDGYDRALAESVQYSQYLDRDHMPWSRHIFSSFALYLNQGSLILLTHNFDQARKAGIDVALLGISTVSSQVSTIGRAQPLT